MKSFQQFINEVYDKDLTTATRKPGEGGRVRASRKKTAPEKRRVKAIGGGKTAPAKDYKDRKDIGKQKPRSSREQQPTRARGTARLSMRDQQKKARAERNKANAGGKGRGELKKAADKLLAKKSAKKVDPKYKPQKPSGYTAHERRKIRRAGERLVRDIRNKKEKPISNYDQKV